MRRWSLRRSSRRVREDAGFTLIEIMMVILIIGMLIAIALPTFLGFRHRAEDRAALSDLRTSIAAAKTYFPAEDTYDGFDAGCLPPANPGAPGCTVARGVEPTVQWVGNGDPPLPQVAIVVSSGDRLLLVRVSKSGTYFCLADGPGGTHFGQGDSTFASVNTLQKCRDAPNP
jgi:type IV pilus assembly protein PilA